VGASTTEAMSAADTYIVIECKERLEEEETEGKGKGKGKGYDMCNFLLGMRQTDECVACVCKRRKLRSRETRRAKTLRGYGHGRQRSS